MTDAPSDRGSLSRHDTWSEPQGEWLPIARAVFRFAIAHSDRPQTETFQDDPRPFSIEAFEKFKSRQDKADANVVDNETNVLSLHNLTTTLREMAGAHRAEINLDEGFRFYFDRPTGGATLMGYAPWHVALPRDPVEIDPQLELEALFNKGDGLYSIDDEEATLTAKHVDAIHAATSHVWYRLILPAFDRLVSAGRVKVYGRVRSPLTQFQLLPADLWSRLALDDWQHGTARDPDGTRYYSIHAADSLPKVSPMQASTIAAETAATNALAAALVRNPNLTRRQASDWCMTNGHHFPETGRPFQDRVWPEARVKAGLPKLATPGRKKSTH
jgi:hypothetical protein